MTRPDRKVSDKFAGIEDVAFTANDEFEDEVRMMKFVIDNALTSQIGQLNHDVKLMFDLGEVKAYEYHDGIVFAAYSDKFSKAIAQGGRYDGLSQSFDSSREATGFSFDLKFLIHNQLIVSKNKSILNAPNVDDSDFSELVNELRAIGHIVRIDLKGTNNVDFVNENGKWKLKE